MKVIREYFHKESEVMYKFTNQFIPAPSGVKVRVRKQRTVRGQQKEYIVEFPVQCWQLVLTEDIELVWDNFHDYLLEPMVMNPYGKLVLARGEGKVVPLNQ